VLLVEYPGYAGAGGAPSYASMKATVLESYDAIASRSDVNTDFIMAYGRSMGGAVATLVAKHRPIVALGLESTFASMRQLAVEKRFPGFLLRDCYENATIVSQLDIPIFVYHGTEDRLIPIHHGLALAKAAKNATLITRHHDHSNGPRPWIDFLAFIEAQTPIQIRQSVS
ncbi:MAG: alpha/beta hydrolase, partial [Symploca sp. SIO2B6]|nr:alpha/beta hydrolase [Symploca sp. SIO2B6]